MAFPVIAALAAQQGADVTSNALSMAQQNYYSKQSQKRVHAMSVDDQVNAPSRYASGLAKAGLPISLALNGAFQSAAAPAAAQPSPHSAPDVASLLSTLGQIKLIDTEVEGKEIENDLKQLELNRKTSEDSTINENMRNMYAQRALSDPDNAEFWNSRAKSVNDYDLGSLTAQSRYDDEIVNMDNRRLRLLDNAVQERVKRIQLNDEPIIRSMASLPQDTRIKIYQDIAKSKSEIVRLASQNLKDDADIAKANVEAQKVLSDIDHAYNSDLVANVKNGDYLGSLLILGSTIAKEAAAGAGAAAVGAATRNPAGAVAGYRNARARAPERSHPFSK